MSKGSRQVILSQLININQEQQEVASGKQNMRAACQKDNMEIKFFRALLRRWM